MGSCLLTGPSFGIVAATLGRGRVSQALSRSIDCSTSRMAVKYWSRRSRSRPERRRFMLRACSLTASRIEPS